MANKYRFTIFTKNCARCKKEIGAFSKKHYIPKQDGKDIIYCSECHNQIEAEHKAREEAQRNKIIFPYFKGFIEKEDCRLLHILNFEHMADFDEKYAEVIVNASNTWHTIFNSEAWKKLIKLIEVRTNYEYESKELSNKLFEFCGEKRLIEIEKIFSRFKIKSEKEYYEKIIECLGENFRSDSEPLFEYGKKRKIVSTSPVEFIKNIERYVDDISMNQYEKNLMTEKTEDKSIDLLDGYEFEGFLAGLFQKMGYKVQQTPHSKDQGADLIIEKIGKKTVVQAKRYSNMISNKAIQEVVAAQKHYKADKALVVTTSYFTRSALQLAQSNQVELWNRDKLKEMIEKYQV